MSDFYRFPETIFVHQNDLLTQLAHAVTEGEEVAEAIALNEHPVRVAEEIIDKIHSLETALRILQRDFNIDPAVIAAGVVLKNELRSYYA